MKLKIRRGTTLMHPIPVGVRADGQIAFEVVFRPSGGVMKLISGMTGGGKTYGEIPVLLTSAALQADQIVIDTVKGVQSYGEIAGALQIYEIDPKRARQLISRLVSHVLPGRTNRLAREGLKEWDPKRSTLRPLRVQIEEAWTLLNSDALIALAVALRSAGGQLTVSIQNPTYEQISPTVRNQMGAYRAYGLADAGYNEFSLPEEVVKAGANPGQWGNEYPGMHYCVMPGMSMREKVLPVRAFADGVGVNTFASAAQYVAARLGPMCPVTAEALGDLWVTNIPPLELVKRMGVITPGPATTQALTTLGVGAAAQDQAEADAPPEPTTLGAPEGEELPDFGTVDPEEGDEDDLTGISVVMSDDERTLTVTDPEWGDEFTIELEPDDGDGDIVDWDEPTHPLVERMIGDPPRDGITPEEFQELITTLVDEFLAVDPHVRPSLRRRDLINIAGDCGWQLPTFYKYLDRDPRIRKGARGEGYVRITRDAA